MEWVNYHEIATMHIDFSDGADIGVGFNTDLKFVLELDVWDNPDYQKNGYNKYIIIEKEDAYNFAKKLDASLAGLPEFFVEKFGDYIDEFYSNTSDVVSYFYSILGFIESYHIKYTTETIKRTTYL